MGFISGQYFYSKFMQYSSKAWDLKLERLSSRIDVKVVCIVDMEHNFAPPFVLNLKSWEGCQGKNSEGYLFTRKFYVLNCMLTPKFQQMQVCLCGQ